MKLLKGKDEGERHKAPWVFVFFRSAIPFVLSAALGFLLAIAVMSFTGETWQNWRSDPHDQWSSIAEHAEVCRSSEGYRGRASAYAELCYYICTYTLNGGVLHLRDITKLMGPPDKIQRLGNRVELAYFLSLKTQHDSLFLIDLDDDRVTAQCGWSNSPQESVSAMGADPFALRSRPAE